MADSVLAITALECASRVYASKSAAFYHVERLADDLLRWLEANIDPEPPIDLRKD